MFTGIVRIIIGDTSHQNHVQFSLQCPSFKVDDLKISVLD
jgi:hypothetical protein